MLSRSGELAEENPCRAFDRPRPARATRPQKGWLLVGPSDRSTAPVWLRQDRHWNATPRSADVHSRRRKPWPCATERVARKRERSPRSAPPAHASARPPARACRVSDRCASKPPASLESAERKQPFFPCPPGQSRHHRVLREWAGSPRSESGSARCSPRRARPVQFAAKD